MSLDLSKTATALLSGLGDASYVKITRTTGGTFDPVAGETTDAITSVLDAIGAVIRLNSNLIDGERIVATDKMVMLDKGVTPTMTDLITFDGISHTIVQILETNHAGTTQLWKVVCRG